MFIFLVSGEGSRLWEFKVGFLLEDLRLYVFLFYIVFFFKKFLVSLV